MTIEQAKDFLPIIQAYAEGKPIQAMYLQGGYNAKYEDWDADEPLDFKNYSYRIKPQPKLRPYTFKEMCEAVKKHGNMIEWHTTNTPCVYSVTSFTDIGVWIGYTIPIDNYKDLMKQATWLDDGSPCGVMEE